MLSIIALQVAAGVSLAKIGACIGAGLAAIGAGIGIGKIGATKNCIRRDRNTTMHIIPKLWIVRWKVVSMMWVLVCCLDWSFIVMNLRGF